MMWEILVHLGWSSSGLKTILFSFRKLPGFQLNPTGWLAGIEEDDEGCPCIFASTPFNNEWHLNVVWSGQLNAKLKHSILFQQATWDMFVTMIPWKTQCWAYNKMAQSFLFLISLERSLKTIMIHTPGLPGVLGRQWAGPMGPDKMISQHRWQRNIAQQCADN